MFRGITHFLTQFGVSIGKKKSTHWCAENSLLETFIYPPCTRPIAYLQPKAVRSTSEALGTPKEEETRSRCPQQLGQPERNTWEVVRATVNPLDPAFLCILGLVFLERKGGSSFRSNSPPMMVLYDFHSLLLITSLYLPPLTHIDPWYPMVSHGQFPPSPMAWLFSDHKVPIGFGLPAGGVTHDRGVGRTVGLGPALGPSSHHRHGQLRSIFGLSKTTWVTWEIFSDAPHIFGKITIGHQIFGARAARGRISWLEEGRTKNPRASIDGAVDPYCPYFIDLFGGYVRISKSSFMCTCTCIVVSICLFSMI